MLLLLASMFVLIMLQESYLRIHPVEVKYYSIIYETIEDISNMISGMSAPIIREEICGLAEVRDIFDSPSLGKIAGCLVIDGTVLDQIQ